MNSSLNVPAIQRSIGALACAVACALIAACDGSSNGASTAQSNAVLGSSAGGQTDPADAPVVSDAEVEQADARARALLAQMTLAEKIDMLHGELNNYYGFYNAPIPRLGIPALTMADGPMGVRIADPNVNGQRATALPSGTALGATWNPELARQYGSVMGKEAHRTGHNVMLGPVLDIARAPLFGRTFENFGEDPLLNGTLGSAHVRGIQESPVLSAVKHYNLYNQEVNRLFGLDVIVGERAIQEIYTRPYAIAVPDARPASVMCSFNKVNGVYACENELLLKDILKEQLDFKGWVMTDYNASFSTVPAIENGLDQELPGASSVSYNPGDPSSPSPSGPAQETCRFCEPLLAAVSSGQVPVALIDDAVLRILREMYLHGLFDNPATIEPLPEAEHGAIARAIEQQAIVLLKNQNQVLPLKDDIKSLVVVGADANNIVEGGGSGLVKPTYTVSPLEGIRNRAKGVDIKFIGGSDPVTPASFLPGPDPVPQDFLKPSSGEGSGLRAEYFITPDFSGTPEIDRVDPYAAINGGFFLFPGFSAASPGFPEIPISINGKSSIRWSGTLTAPVTGPYVLALTSTGVSRLFVDGEEVVSTPGIETVTTLPQTDTVTLNFEAGSTHTIRVEFTNTAPATTDTGPQIKFGWIPPAGTVSPRAQAAADLARTADAAIVFVRDYGSESGDRSTLRLPNGQGDVIKQVAAANPNTIVVMRTGGAVATADWDTTVPAVLQAWYGGQEQGNAIADVLFGDVNPSGKLPLTMPVDDAQTPVSSPARYPGIGTEVQYSEGIFVGYRGYEEFGITPRYPFGHGLSYTNFEYSNLRTTPTSATVTVTNSGDRAGSDVVQAYVGKLPVPVATAPKALAGFVKVNLAPGQSEDITIPLSPESMAYWDEETDAWVPAVGEIPVLVGASSADIRLRGTVQQAASSEPAPGGEPGTPATPATPAPATPAPATPGTGAPGGGGSPGT